MESKYQINGGQQGAVGDYATAINFTQLWESKSEDIDLKLLAVELEELRAKLAPYAEVPEHYTALGEVATAEVSAKNGNGSKALEHLKKAGEWLWDVATKVGIGVVTLAAKTALGL